MEQEVEAFLDLGKLETFDRELFSTKRNTPKNLSEFILAIALFCNDLKDVLLLNKLIDQLAPAEDEKQFITPRLAQYGGLKLHMGRLYFSQINELAELLEKSSSIYTTPDFKEVLRKLPKESREKWDELHNVLVLHNDLPKSEFRNLLTIARNRISWHYDGDQLRQGYQKQFVEHDNEPYVSRGNNLGQERFYFVDGAAETSLNREIASRKAMNYPELNDEVAKAIHISLFPLIKTFINSYSTWQKPKKTKISELDLPKFN